MDAAFLQDRITATKAQIIAHEEAITALTTGGVFSYTLDTGQSRQTVTRESVVGMNKTLDALYNRCATLEARLNGAGVIARPCF